MFKYIATVFVAAFILVGATKCNEQLQSVAVTTCGALDEIYAHYDSLVESQAVPVSWQNRVATVRVLTVKGCADPAALTTVKLIRLAGDAYLVLKGALQASQGQGDRDWDAVKGLEKLEALRVRLERLK